jgi:hypothetical protein
MVERYPYLKEEVGGSNPGCEISSLPNGKLVWWSTTSCALALAYWPFVSKNKIKMWTLVNSHLHVFIENYINRMLYIKRESKRKYPLL